MDIKQRVALCANGRYGQIFDNSSSSSSSTTINSGSSSKQQADVTPSSHLEKKSKHNSYYSGSSHDKQTGHTAQYSSAPAFVFAQRSGATSPISRCGRGWRSIGRAHLDVGDVDGVFEAVRVHDSSRSRIPRQNIPAGVRRDHLPRPSREMTHATRHSSGTVRSWTCRECTGTGR